MGNSLSQRKKQLIRLQARDDVDIFVEDLTLFSFGVADEYEVQHYMPPQFPLLPNITPARLEACRRTWGLIQNAATDAMKSYDKSGIVLFYNEFFYRLFQRDTTFRVVFPNKKQRGEVLIKALSFILGLKADSSSSIENMKNRCRFLGHKHRSYTNVRPHHFAMYTMTCVEVIMHWLGSEASVQVGDAWSNVVGFALKYILEPYLHRQTDPYEYYQNTTIAAVRDITESSADGSADLKNSRSAMSMASSERSFQRRKSAERGAHKPTN